MRERFETLADAAVASLRSGEHCTVGFVGEKTDFARLNRGRVRQAGTVDQTALTVRLVEGRRHVARQLSLSGTDRDTQMVAATIASLRDVLPHLPEDPFLDIHQSESGDTDAGAHDAVDGMDAVAQVIDFASAGGQRLDLVGIWASGRVARGFASSWGQRSWFARSSWSLDFCVVHAGDKAVKRTVSGLVWEPRQVAAAIQTARAELVALGRPIKKIAPGAYRSWLTPAATGEIWKLIRGGFGKQGLATLTSPLLSLAQGKSMFDERISVREHVSGGMAPGFNGDGWPRLASVELVERGKLVGALVSSRSAREFGIPGTGAGSSESPEALAVAPGSLAEADVLGTLGTGIRVSDLWYLNYSDRAACRVTGMTRFATFWVEDGEIVAPLSVMRFDDSVPRLFGDGLVALGAEAPLALSTSTYFHRATGSVRTPGALVEGLRLTL